MDQLAYELRATFSFCNHSGGSIEEKPRADLGDLRPSKAIVPEKACVDDSVKEEQKFHSLFEVKERSRGGKGDVLVIINNEPSAESPSRPLFSNPRLGMQVLLDSVFRSQLRGKASYTVFTSWVATPPFGPSKEAICYSAGHCFEETFGIHYTDHNLHLDWVSGAGCFGSLVKPNDFDSHGFGVSKEPLALAYDDTEDFACFRILDADVAAFLLPCSPQEVLQKDKKPFVATYGYPCTQYFLSHAYEELIEQKKDHGIGEAYKSVVSNPIELYRLLVATFGSFTEGQLLCSPGVLIGMEGSKLKLKSSTVEGSSGSPIIPVGFEGYSIGTHDAGSKFGDFNLATSTDSPGYVASYSSFTLPHLPGRKHPIWEALNRDLGPFDRWLTMHGLKWEDRNDGEGIEAEGFVTPPPPKRLHVLCS